jgi:hypothetical protein
MKAFNERLQKLQEEQAARREALEKGRIRIIRPDDKPASTREPQKKSTNG